MPNGAARRRPADKISEIGARSSRKRCAASAHRAATLPCRSPCMRAPPCLPMPCKPSATLRFAVKWASSSTCSRCSAGWSLMTSRLSIVVYYVEVPTRVTRVGGGDVGARARLLLTDASSRASRARQAQLGVDGAYGIRPPWRVWRGGMTQGGWGGAGCTDGDRPPLLCIAW